MNKELERFARNTLKTNLAMLKESNHRIFKLMYARDDGKSVEAAEAMDINDVVDIMDAKKLDWAMTQVENSLAKL